MVIRSSPSRAELHHGGAVRVSDPDIVLGIDGHAMRLVLMADHVIADLQDQFVFGIELIKLRTACSFTLKYPKIALRIQSNRGNTACAGRQNVWIW